MNNKCERCQFCLRCMAGLHLAEECKNNDHYTEIPR